MSEAWKQWEGQVIDSRFPLRQLLGESSHSAVFLTERLDRGGAKAAIKLVAASSPAADSQLDRWRQVARLSHPNLLPLYHYGRCRLGNLDLLFAVMEFADETLAEILPQRALTAPEAQQVLEVLVSALAFLHQQGLVHGDVQPANILAVGETIKLSSDTVRPIQNGGSAAHKAVSADASPATSGSVEPAGDIYSLGITLVQTLTQRSPFDAGSSLGHPAEPLPSPFDDIVLHALHPDPQLRWTAADIALKLNPAASAAAAGASASTKSVEKKSRTASTDSIPAAAAVKAAPKKTLEGKATNAAPRKVPAAGVPPTSVPLSPVAPIRRQASSGSLLRYAAVIGLAAVMVFLAVKWTYRGSSGGDSRAAVSEKEKAATPPISRNTAPPPVAEKTAAKVAESRPLPALAVETPATKASSPVPPAPKQEAAVKQPEAKISPSEPPRPEAVTMKSEVKAAPTSSAGPDVLQQVLPDVSPKALSTIHGTVRMAIRVQVDATGKVSDAQLDTPSGSTFFNDLALKAARQWQFQPADAQPEVSRSYLLRFQFTQAGPQASSVRSR